jgi:GDP-4-dehydro-6-deoxy-D-mannose reductase
MPVHAMNDTVVVTGASGFVGSHLIDLSVPTHAVVIGWHRPGTSPPPGAAPIEWRAVDALDAGAVRRAVADARPSIVYHCAGAAHIGGSWHHAAQTLELNVLGTAYLFDAVRAETPNCRLLVPGSGLVYQPSDQPLDERAPLGPQSPYATSKLAQELLGTTVARDEGLPVFLTRSFNHFGPRQDPSFAASSFARQLCRIEAGLEEPVIHVGNLDAQRDLTDVRDVVRAYRAILERGCPGRVYNVCSGRAYPIAEILDRLLAQVRVRVDIRPEPERMRPNDVPLVLGDARRISTEVGWAPAIPIEQTLTDLLNYWRGTVRP